MVIVGHPHVVQSRGELNVVLQLRVQNRIEVESVRCYHAFFDDVPGAESGDGVALSAVGMLDRLGIGPVGIVEIIPVHLAEVDIFFHPLLHECRLVGICCGVIAGKISVIIRSWVAGVVPVEGCGAAISCRIAQCCHDIRLVADFIFMREDRIRLVRFAYVGIPDFSVLVPPARVIVVRAREVHHLLHRRPLSAVFRWGAEYHEGE